MTSLWFVVPAAGRLELSAVCLRQLRRTCDTLAEHGIEATAVVIADDDNLDTASDLGFATVERPNQFLGAKFNDGIQLACDPRHNPRPADYVIPFGSDDWVDWRIIPPNLPGPDTVVGFQQITFVAEDGRTMASRHVGCKGGAGIRIYPRQIIRHLGYRPADEDRTRFCDTSILTNVERVRRVTVRHPNIDGRQIVDWKSYGPQLNTFANVSKHRLLGSGDPFADLADIYPSEAFDDMDAVYSLEAVAA